MNYRPDSSLLQGESGVLIGWMDSVLLIPITDMTLISGSLLGFLSENHQNRKRRKESTVLHPLC